LIKGRREKEEQEYHHKSSHYMNHTFKTNPLTPIRVIPHR